MKLIKLHTRSDGEVYINPEYIVSIWECNHSSCVKTIKDVNENNGFLVKETPDQIIKVIHDAPKIDTSSFVIQKIEGEEFMLEETKL